MKKRTWKITACVKSNPDKRMVYTDTVPANMEPQAVKEALMMRVEEYTGVPMRCVRMEEARENGT